MAKTVQAEAAALEADAEKYPQERGKILLLAAAVWRRAGRDDRARELLARLIEEGGEDGCYARIDLAESYSDEGATDKASAELAQLASDPALDHGHCMLVGELLGERKDLEGALGWFDRGVALFSPDELDALRKPSGSPSMPARLAAERREVRRRLGLRPDEVDKSAPRGPVDGERARSHDQVRVLVFQRAERAKARQHWPEEYPENDDVYYPTLDRGWRDLAEQGIASIRAAPATVAGLMAFAELEGEPANDQATMVRYGESFRESDLIVWPPGRNDPCWCGSGGKYKKCCGRILAQ